MNEVLVPAVLAFAMVFNLVAGIAIMVYARRPLHVGMGIVAIGISIGLSMLVLMEWTS